MAQQVEIPSPTKRRSSGSARVGSSRAGSLWVLGLFASTMSCADKTPRSPDASASASAEVPTPEPERPRPWGAPDDAPPLPELDVTNVRYADVRDVEIVEVHPVDPPSTWASGEVGKPRVLLEAPHLQLAHDTPVAPGRGFVDITDGPGSGADTLHAVLVDFELGEVARFEKVFTHQPLLGFSWGGIRKPDGSWESTLIHSSGEEVRWTSPVVHPGSVDVLVHPGQRRIFLVHRNVEGRTHGKSQYTVWTDLKQKPPAFDRELPFVPWVDGYGEGGETAAAFAEPAPDDPSENNIVVRSNATENACTRGELSADGGFQCMPETDLQIGDGWRIRQDGKSLLAYHPESKRAQRLDWSDVCDTSLRIHEVAMTSPPRVEFGCIDLEDDDYYWSPEGVVRVPHKAIEGSVLERGKHHQLLYGAKADDQGHWLTTTWLDRRRLRLLRTAPLRVQSVGEARDHVLVDRGTEMWLLDVGAAVLVPVHTGPGCADYGFAAREGPLWAYVCLAKNESIRWVEVLDVEARVKWRLPAVHYDDVWLQDEPRLAVGLTRGGSDRLFAWPLDRD